MGCCITFPGGETGLLSRKKTSRGFWLLQKIHEPRSKMKKPRAGII